MGLIYIVGSLPIIGFHLLKGPKRWDFPVNIYVLNKMPRDCTAPPTMVGRCDEQSGFMFAGSNTKHG